MVATTIKDFIDFIKLHFFHHDVGPVRGIPFEIALVSRGPFPSHPRHFQFSMELPTSDDRLLQIWKFYVRELKIIFDEALRGFGQFNFNTVFMHNQQLIDPSVMYAPGNNSDLDLVDQLCAAIEAIDNTNAAFPNNALIPEIQRGFFGDDVYDKFTNSGRTDILNSPGFDIRNCTFTYKMYFAIDDNVDLDMAFVHFSDSLRRHSDFLRDYITNREQSVEVELANPDIVENENQMVEDNNDDEYRDPDEEVVISDVEPDDPDENLEEPLIIPMTNRTARVRRDPRTLVVHDPNRAGHYNLRRTRTVNPRAYTFQKQGRIHVGRGLKKVPPWMLSSWNESKSMRSVRRSLKNLKQRQSKIMDKRRGGSRS